MNLNIETWDETFVVSDDNSDKIFSFYSKYYRHYLPDDQIPDKKTYRTILNSKHEFRRIIRLIAFNTKRQVVGYSTITILKKTSPEYASNGSIARISLMVLPKFHNYGVGSKLLDNLVKIATDFEVDKLEYLAFTDSALHLSKKYKSTPGPIGGERRVRIIDIDTTMITSWITKGKELNTDKEFKFVDYLPDEDIHQYMSVYNETMNDTPSEGLESITLETVETRRAEEEEWKKGGFTPIMLYVKDKAGKIIGITEMLYEPYNSKVIYQMLTGVLQSHRGNGIGKLLKAKMIEKVMKELPKVKIISTGTADSNQAMTSINKRIGFMPFRDNQFFTLSIKSYLELTK